MIYNKIYHIESQRKNMLESGWGLSSERKVAGAWMLMDSLICTFRLWEAKGRKRCVPFDAVPSSAICTFSASSSQIDELKRISSAVASTLHQWQQSGILQTSWSSSQTSSVRQFFRSDSKSHVLEMHFLASFVSKRVKLSLFYNMSRPGLFPGVKAIANEWVISRQT